VFLVLAAPAWVSLAIWIVLLAGRGGFWRMNLRLPEAETEAEGATARTWPGVTAVIPARDEAGILPLTLPSVLAQDYPGPLTVIVVDDASTDGTGDVAVELAAALERSAELRVLRGAGRGRWRRWIAGYGRWTRALSSCCSRTRISRIPPTACAGSFGGRRTSGWTWCR
jgi:cellulose synthase/poly-beta-1,6-N-acetylglucosamine synthase-like glycosyltransferase